MRVPDTDGEGYLVDPFDWSEDIAKEFAHQENIQLTEDHWDAINFMRQYYSETSSPTGCSSCDKTSCRAVGAWIAQYSI